LISEMNILSRQSMPSTYL